MVINTVWLGQRHSRGGGGSTPICSYVSRLWSFFGFKILNFWGFSDFGVFFGGGGGGGHHKIGLHLGVISMHFRVFS